MPRVVTGERGSVRNAGGPGDPGLRIGVDIGGTKALGIRLGARGEVLGEVRLPSPHHTGEVIPVIGRLVEELAGPEARVSSLGIGVPALVDGEGVLRFSPHLPGLVGLPLIPELCRTWPGAAVWSGNDATAAGWAEHAVGAGRGADEMLMVTLGTGIGGGMVSGGRIREGAHRFAGEFGHMVIDPHGPLCPCGNRGCWERYASGSGLGQLGREAAMAGQLPRVVELAGGDPEAVRGEHVTTAAGEGDQPAVQVMGRFAWWLALGLANLATILDPELVVLGGGIGQAAGLLDQVRDELHMLIPIQPELRVSALGDDAVVDGCLAAGLDRAWATTIAAMHGPDGS